MRRSCRTSSPRPARGAGRGTTSSSRPSRKSMTARPPRPGRGPCRPRGGPAPRATARRATLGGAGARPRPTAAAASPTCTLRRLSRWRRRSSGGGRRRRRRRPRRRLTTTTRQSFPSTSRRTAPLSAAPNRSSSSDPVPPGCLRLSTRRAPAYTPSSRLLPSAVSCRARAWTWRTTPGLTCRRVPTSCTRCSCRRRSLAPCSSRRW
mmetsp:Transcript_34366/g.88015  ORF Transcript_34366/g.88015 Transcript_34366/m.88015 type:complete len:206 (+) Transcript_34366:564-1181(+)